MSMKWHNRQAEWGRGPVIRGGQLQPRLVPSEVHFNLFLHKRTHDRAAERQFMAARSQSLRLTQHTRQEGRKPQQTRLHARTGSFRNGNAMLQFEHVHECVGSPLRPSGQSPWLQIQRSGVDSRGYQVF
jgi:hypothetical protein